MGGLRGAVHAVEFFLNFQEALRHLVQRLIDDGRKQPLLIAEADVDEICAGVGGRGDSAQRRVGIALVQKFCLCAVQYAFGYAFKLFCHSHASIHNSVS